MKVGILFTSHPDHSTEPYPHRAIHERVTREILEAEDLGFDSVWIAEHHFSNKYGILPDPFSYLSYLAAKTTRIRLGAAVMVVPLHHPMRIVENAAFVDILSGGRFQLGMGSGYRPYEFEGLGISYEERRDIQAEAIPLILDGFHKKRDGKYFRFSMDETCEVFPQPVQQPHPPFFMAAGTAGSIRRAARNGFGLMQSLLPSVATIGEHIALYREHMAEAPAPLDANPAFGEVDVVRMTYVAPTDARARAESEDGIVRHMKSFLGSAVGAYLGDVAEKTDESQFAYERLVADTILHGAPDTVLRKIELFRDVGATSLMVHYPPYYGPGRTLDMLRLFAAEVLPELKRMDTGARSLRAAE